MSRLVRLAVLLLLVSCGGDRTAPRDLDNACAIISERPQYLRAMQKSEARWGIPINVQMATIYQESKFIGNAKTPHKYALGIIPMGRQSSAFGYSQAIDSTWDDYKNGPGNFGSRRDRFDDAVDFMGWYMDLSSQNLGIAKTDARNQYLAYHEGRSGFASGSHKDKAWLLRVADEVGRRSDLYQMQLISCGAI
jgi:hypothetical protein